MPEVTPPPVMRLRSSTTRCCHFHVASARASFFVRPARFAYSASMYSCRSAFWRALNACQRACLFARL